MRIPVLLACLLFAFAVGACSASAPVLKVDSKVLIASPAPIIRNGLMYVPISIFQDRAFRDVGLGVEWKKGEKAGTIYWEDSDLIYDVTAGRSWVPGQVAGSRQKLPGTPFMVGHQLMVPLRTPVIDMPSARDFQVRWDARNRVATVCRSKAHLQRRYDENTVRSATELDTRGEWRESVTLLRRLARGKPLPWMTTHWGQQLEVYSLLGTTLVRHQPELGEGYFYLGLAAAVREDYAEAQRQFRLGSELDPRNPDLVFGIGWSMLRQECAQSSFGKSVDLLRVALPYYQRALALNPKHRDALASLAYMNLHLAEILNSRGGYTWLSRTTVAPYLGSAARYLERLLRLEPRSHGARQTLLNTYAQIGRVGEYVKLSGVTGNTADSFTYFESGRVVSKPRGELQPTEREAISGGHMPWRHDPASVAAAVIYYGLTADPRPRTNEKQIRRGNWLDLIIDRPGEHTTIQTTGVRGTTATVEIATNGTPDATVQLQRPFTGWWYVTSFRFER